MTLSVVVQVLLAFAVQEGQTVTQAQHESLVSPGAHGELSHWTWQSSPPNGTSIDVTYFIHTALHPGGPPAMTVDMVNRIRDAANTWNNAGGLVRLVEVPVAAGANIHIHNMAIDGPGGVLATSLITFTAAHQAPDYDDGHTWHRITDATIQMDNVGAWHDTPGLAVPAGQFDYQSVMLHELGHALGLGHADPFTEPGSVMLPALSSGVARRNLTAADMQALQHLYGSAEPATVALFGLGLALLGTVNRRGRRAGVVR